MSQPAMMHGYHVITINALCQNNLFMLSTLFRERPAVHDTSVPVPIPTVIEQMRNDVVDDIEATLELTADDTPTLCPWVQLHLVEYRVTEPADGRLPQPLAPAQRYRSGNKYNKTIPSKQN